MDKLAEEPDDARYEITDALESLRSIYRENSSAFILQLFLMLSPTKSPKYTLRLFQMNKQE